MLTAPRPRYTPATARPVNREPLRRGWHVANLEKLEAEFLKAKQFATKRGEAASPKTIDAYKRALAREERLDPLQEGVLRQQLTAMERDLADREAARTQLEARRTAFVKATGLTPEEAEVGEIIAGNTPVISVISAGSL